MNPDIGPSSIAQGSSHKTAQHGPTPEIVSHEGLRRLTRGTRRAVARKNIFRRFFSFKVSEPEPNQLPQEKQAIAPFQLAKATPLNQESE